jgi:hypothetical protein
MTEPTPENSPLTQAKRQWSTLTMPDRLGAVAGFVAFVAGFLPWYTVSFHMDGFPGGSSHSASGWSVSFGGWFPTLLMTLLAVAIVVRSAGVVLPPQADMVLRLGQVVVPPLAVVIILIRWLSYPGGSSEFASAGAGFGLFIGLAAALAGCAGAVLVFRASKPRH